MFTSHEKEVDFVNFFNSFIEVCKIHDIDFIPKYIVIDACKAMYKAIRKMFPNSVILMCWFHLRMNVKKHKSLIPTDKYEEVQNEIKE
jgi:nitrogenase subunit NifH